MSGKKSSSQLPIAIIDSGIGGLSVYHALRTLLPYEKYIYFADTAHCPYGNRSSDDILDLVTQNIAFLLKQEIKALVIACHTISITAYDYLAPTIHIPLFSMISPTLSLIQESTMHTLGILGTKRTIQSDRYQKEITQLFPKMTIYAQSCPNFVTFVEEGTLYPKELQIHIPDVDAFLLVCTHFSFLKTAIENSTGIRCLDPANTCAIEVKSYLKKRNLLSPSTVPSEPEFFVTANPEKFIQLAKLYLNLNVNKLLSLKLQSLKLA